MKVESKITTTVVLTIENIIDMLETLNRIPRDMMLDYAMYKYVDRPGDDEQKRGISTADRFEIVLEGVPRTTRKNNGLDPIRGKQKPFDPEGEERRAQFQKEKEEIPEGNRGEHFSAGKHH